MRMSNLSRVSVSLLSVFTLGLSACADDGDKGGTNTDTDVTDTDTDITDTDVTDTDTDTDTACTSNDDCDGETPICNIETGACEALAGGELLGNGSAESVSIVEIYRPATAIEATDLDFHPDRDELWVMNRRFEVSGTCAQSNPNSARCRSMGSTTTIIFEPSTENQQHQTLEDGNSWHFMRRAPSMAMGANNTWGSCSEAITGNFEDDPTPYNGPSLWSADLSIFAKPSTLEDGSRGNGSHLDMLHNTPLCMGIAHERDNVYWLFNGHSGAIDKVDFAEDHGPGADYHGDAHYYRYLDGKLTRRPNVPSHMIFNHADNHLYFIDGGTSRIMKLDTTSGERVGSMRPSYDNLPASRQGIMGNEVFEVLVDTGVLEEPSGMALHNDTLYVTDHKTSKIHAFTLQGQLIRSIETNLPEGTLAGITVGHDEKLYFVDMLTGAVRRVDVN